MKAIISTTLHARISFDVLKIAHTAGSTQDPTLFLIEQETTLYGPLTAFRAQLSTDQLPVIEW